MEEFHNVANAMAHGKALGSNGIVIEFYVRFSHIIGIHCFNMIANSIKAWRFPKVIIKGLINFF
jgi:hypothetical protein